MHTLDGRLWCTIPPPFDNLGARLDPHHTSHPDYVEPLQSLDWRLWCTIPPPFDNLGVRHGLCDTSSPDYIEHLHTLDWRLWYSIQMLWHGYLGYNTHKPNQPEPLYHHFGLGVSKLPYPPPIPTPTTTHPWLTL